MAVSTTVVEGKTLPRKTAPGYSWLSVHMSNAVMDVLRDVAKEDGRSVSNMVRHIVERHLRSEGHTWEDAPPPLRGPRRGQAIEDEATE